MKGKTEGNRTAVEQNDIKIPMGGYSKQREI